MARHILRHRVSPQQTAVAPSSPPARKWPDPDPHYQAIRLRGLAGLIRSASKNEHDAPNLDDLEVSFFISTELREIADKLEVA